MLSYLIRRVLVAILVVWGVLTLLFFALHAMPGSPEDRFLSEEMADDVRENMRKNLGLDQPLPVQYVRMMWSLVTLSGMTYDQRPVAEILLPALKNSLILALVAMSLVYLTGVLLGIFQAVNQYRRSDGILTAVGLFFYSMPSFWLGLMLILLFCSWLKVLPASGMVDAVMHDYMSPAAQIRDRLVHMALPVATLWLAGSASIARYMRSSMLEVLRQDYVRTARAKGLSERRVILRHALRNALLPIVTLLGLQLPHIISGAVLVETVFAWPGMGREVVGAIFRQDFPIVLNFTFIFSVMVATGNLVADLLYAVVDPRIRLG